MTSAHAVVTALLAAASSGNTKNTANPIVSLLPLILIFGVAYVFFLRPRSQAARRQRDTLMELSAGDEVLTGAGIFGTVLDVEEDRVTLETAPGTRITVLRSTIARKLNNPVGDEPSWDDHDEDEAHDAYQDYEHDHPEGEGDEHAAEHEAEHEAEGHDTGKPGTSKPESGKPDTDKPDTGKPDTGKPDTDKPGTSTPGGGTPDAPGATDEGKKT
jgi:preprotein translocase subunit YajC